MSFTIADGDGNVTEEVWSCVECPWRSTKKHCREGASCVLCGASCEKASTITRNTGMSDFKYRELLDRLEEDAAGVGSGTVENIEEHFESGDDFLDAAKTAYRDMDLSALQEVRGVGESSAKQIGITVADVEGWEGGALFTL